MTCCSSRPTLEFSGPEVDWFALSPLLVLVGAALFLLVVGALTPRVAQGLVRDRHGGGGRGRRRAGDVLWDDITDNGPSTLVGGALAFDTFGLFVTIAICAAVVARGADQRRLPVARGLRRARGLRPVARRRHRGHRDGVRPTT